MRTMTGSSILYNNTGIGYVPFMAPYRLLQRFSSTLTAAWSVAWAVGVGAGLLLTKVSMRAVGVARGGPNQLAVPEALGAGE